MPGPKDYLASMFEPVDEPNRLFYGDNLDVMRRHIKDESVDLVYLDPPFNSNRNYNVIFAQHNVYDSGEAAQIEAFDDTWHWTPDTDAHYEAALAGGLPAKVADALSAMRTLLGENDAMAYLVNMAPRLVELRRTLKPTGSLYLHCDPTMSHYLKVLLDAIFSPSTFRNEIVWRRYGAHNDVGQGSRHYGRVHDTILFYTPGDDPIWEQQFVPLDPAYIESTYRNVEPETGRRYTTTPMTGPGGAAKGNPYFEWNGHSRHWRYSKETMERLDKEGRLHYSRTGYVRQKLYLDESKGVPVQDVWGDISSLSGSHRERLGYQTQKPVALLERIITASSNEGDLVLDPFCGCGTTIEAAERHGRRWIGIDITYIAVDLIEKRLLHTFGDSITDGYEVHGIPRDLLGAQALFREDHLDFERWAVSLVDGTPNEKQVGDKGMDGVIRFFTDAKGGTGRALVSVKGGKMIGPQFVRDLLGTVETQKAEMGVLVSITKPTPGMKDAADHAGTYTWPVNGQKFPRIQLFSVKELLAGKRPQMPPTLTPYIKPQRLQVPAEQMPLDLLPPSSASPSSKKQRRGVKRV